MSATKSGFEQHDSPRPAARVALMACALFGVGSAELCLAGSPTQTAFPSPDDASRALLSAVEEHDQRALTKILGGSELIDSDDKDEDSLDRERFVQKYLEMHRWVRESGGIATLYIGAENWPFPIPLVARSGVWRFDSQAGFDEIRFRRVGENEITAIATCEALITATDHPGTDSEADRLVKTMLTPHDGKKPSPHRGYYFHILPSSSGGFAAIAYPAEYRSSGVMTFVATHDGSVSEKDLGPKTANIAKAMTTYHADATWAPVESKP
jgi:hypothetical protein